MLVVSGGWAQPPALLADSLRSGFRGLSVVNENVVWMSGRKGLVGNSVNHGKKWSWHRVKEYDQLDFRSIHAFSKTSAVMASAGTPAVILTTDDGGRTWLTRYRSDDSTMFFDGIAFWDETHGIIFGDPVNGRMCLMETVDAGKTWKEIPFENRPQLEPGEASFAASGTSICVLPGGQVWIATGGSKARLFHSRDYGHHWEAQQTPMLHGKSSQGIFSVAFHDSLNGVIAGGDYLADSVAATTIFYTRDGGKSWMPGGYVNGYYSCIVYVHDTVVLEAVGARQWSHSYDGGKSWYESTARSANTMAAYRVPGKGVAVFYAGGKAGFIYEFQPYAK